LVPLDAEGLKVVKEQIHTGTPVLDVERKTLGTVEAYDDDSGYMRIGEGRADRQGHLPARDVGVLSR